mgnify:CR=1 FL=1
MIMRKNLWQKLSPSMRDKIESVQVKYPSMYTYIKTDLETESFWDELSINTVSNILTFTDTPLYAIDSNTWKFGDGILCED